MSTFNEKAGTFILTAVQAVNDVKKMVEERVKALVKDAMAGYDAELSAIRERLDILEKKVRPAAEKPAPAARETAPKTRNVRPRKKVAPKPCAVLGCKKASISKGLCKNHYYQLKRGTIVKNADGYEPAKRPEPAPAVQPEQDTPGEAASE